MSISYKNQSKSMDWFLYGRDLSHEKVNLHDLYNLYNLINLNEETASSIFILLPRWFNLLHCK